MVEPAIFKAVERVEQRHVQEADRLTDRIDGEQTHNHSLESRKIAKSSFEKMPSFLLKYYI